MTPPRPRPKPRPVVAAGRAARARQELTGPEEDDSIITARAVLATLPRWMRPYFRGSVEPSREGHTLNPAAAAMSLQLQGLRLEGRDADAWEVP